MEGQAKDRAEGTLRQIAPGGRQVYRYAIRVVSERAEIDALRALNG